MKTIKYFVYILVLGLLIAGCKDENESLTAIKVKQTALFLKPGETIRLEASPVPATVTKVSFAYTCDAAGVATVSADGLVTAVAEGTAKITVTAGGFSKTVPITVASDIIPLTDITLTPDAVEPMEIGDTIRLTATPVPANATEAVFSWATSKSTIVTVADDGMVVAVGSGSAEVAARNGTGDIIKTIALTVKSKFSFPEIWTFNDASNLAAADGGNGNPLTFSGEGIVSVDGPTSDNKAVRVPRGSYLLAEHGITPDGAKVKTFSIMLDVKLPEAGPWYSLVQTDLSNKSDGEIFVNGDGGMGCGDSGYGGAISFGEWHRFVMTNRNGHLVYYLDGVEFLNTTVTTDRFDLDPAGVILFGDQDGDDHELDVAEVRIWDSALSAEDVAALGLIKLPAVEGGEWLFDDPTNLSKATSGVDLEFVGNITGVEGPTTDDKAVNVPIGSYLKVTHNIHANGRDNGKVNQYSIQMDIKLGQDGQGWYGLLQTDMANSAHDAVSWIDVAAGYKIGWAGTGGYGGSVPKDGWHRLIITVNDRDIAYYLDGSLIHTGLEQNDQTDVLALDLSGVLLLTDRSAGYDGEFDVAKLRMWNKTLSSDEVSALGSLAPAEDPTVPDKVGSWLFDDDADLTKASTGSALTFSGAVTSVAGPSTDNKAANVPIGSYINVNHGIAANGRDNGMVNQYTIMMDIKLGEAGNSWYSLLQTDMTNSAHDAVAWINAGDGYKIGWDGTNGYAGAVPNDVWHRLVMVVDNRDVKYYLDGTLIYTGQEKEDKANMMALELSGFLLFTEKSGGYDGEFNISELAIWNVALNSAQAATLGSIPTN